MAKQKRVLYFSILLFIVIYIYPIAYKDNIQNLIFTFFTFFIPALFPTAFIIVLILKTQVLQELNKTKPKIVSFLMTFILAFGGTPILLSILSELDIKEKDKLYRFISPSFSYCLYLLKPSLNNLAYLFSFILILPPLILNVFCPMVFDFKTNDKSFSTWEEMISSSHQVIKSIYFLVLTILIISLLYPLSGLIFPKDISNFIMGLLQYTNGSILIAEKIDFLKYMQCFFIVEFNGFASFMALKKECKDIKILKLIVKRIVISLVLLVPLAFLFKAFYN